MAKRVAFAPAHESLQRGQDAGVFRPEYLDGGSFLPQFQQYQPAPSLSIGKEEKKRELEVARRRVEELEKLVDNLELAESISNTSEYQQIQQPIQQPLVILRSGPHVMQPPFASSPATQAVTNTNQNAAVKSTFVLPELFGGKEFDDRQPVPMPPPGFTYVWEYAGYRNKDGTITTVPKEKVGANPAIAGQAAIEVVNKAGAPKPAAEVHKSPKLAPAKDDAKPAAVKKFTPIEELNQLLRDGRMAITGRDEERRLVQQQQVQEKGERMNTHVLHATPVQFLPAVNLVPHVHLSAEKTSPRYALAHGSDYYPDSTLSTTGNGARLLTPDECKRFGAPLGTTWKIKKDLVSPGVAGDKGSASWRLESSSVMPSPNTPVIYGGYMTSRLDTSSKLGAKDEKTWQA